MIAPIDTCMSGDVEGAGYSASWTKENPAAVDLSCEAAIQKQICEASIRGEIASTCC